MVNKNLKNIADAVGSEELETLKKNAPMIRGFDYVETLGFYVAKELKERSYEENWFKVKEFFKKKSSFLLTPAQMWLYWDYCKEKGEYESFEKDSEWMNVIVELSNIIVNPGVTNGSFHSGRRLRKVLPVKGRRFGRNEVSKVSGLPLLNRVKGEDYELIRTSNTVPNTIVRLPKMTFDAEYSPIDFSKGVRGRECVTRENMNERIDKKEVDVTRW